jgi:AraC-like DNA-binding protein
MTISISQSAHDELFDAMIQVETTRHPDPLDTKDFMGNFPPLLGKGFWRTIALRDGLELVLGNLQLCDRYVTAHPEVETDWLELHLHLSGVHQLGGNVIGAGQYGLYGSGLLPRMVLDVCDRQAFWEVIVSIREDVLRSFIGDQAGELPTALEPWVRSSEEKAHYLSGTATPAMQLAARQMLRCTFQGMPKRMFLEGKALELLGLVAAAEINKYDSDRPYLPNDLVDRIHHARDILHQRMDDPLSLGELARLVGLNECTLKREFRYCFGKTVFGYLHDYRMEQAWQVLEMGDWRVGEVASMVGYSNLAAFSRAFSKRFKINPRDCLRKNSV